MNLKSSSLQNFRKLSPQKRLEAIRTAFDGSSDFLNAMIGDGSLPLSIADGMIENVVGRFELPLGEANFKVTAKSIWFRWQWRNHR